MRDILWHDKCFARFEIENLAANGKSPDLQCGQAVLAMLLDVSVESICEELQNERETTFRDRQKNGVLTLDAHLNGIPMNIRGTALVMAPDFRKTEKCLIILQTEI